MKTFEFELDREAALRIGLREHAGYRGAFTTNEAPGAFPNGTTVAKIAEDDGGDLHPIGSIGVVLGSLSDPSLGVGHFVEWKDTPRVASFVVGRIARVEVP